MITFSLKMKEYSLQGIEKIPQEKIDSWRIEKILPEEERTPSSKSVKCFLKKVIGLSLKKIFNEEKILSLRKWFSYYPRDFHNLGPHEGIRFNSSRTKYASSPRNVLKSLGRFQVSSLHNTSWWMLPEELLISSSSGTNICFMGS